MNFKANAKLSIKSKSKPAVTKRVSLTGRTPLKI